MYLASWTEKSGALAAETAMGATAAVAVRAATLRKTSAFLNIGNPLIATLNVN